MNREQDILADSEPMRLVCGIYFLIRDGKIVYVGQSSNIMYRIYTHEKEGKRFDSFTIHEYPESYTERELSEIEADHMVHFRPEYNKQLPKNETWASLTTLRSNLGLNRHKMKEYVESKQICSVNHFYRRSDFQL